MFHLDAWAACWAHRDRAVADDVLLHILSFACDIMHHTPIRHIGARMSPYALRHALRSLYENLRLSQCVMYVSDAAPAQRMADTLRQLNVPTVLAYATTPETSLREDAHALDSCHIRALVTNRPVPRAMLQHVSLIMVWGMPARELELQLLLGNDTTGSLPDYLPVVYWLHSDAHTEAFRSRSRCAPGAWSEAHGLPALLATLQRTLM